MATSSLSRDFVITDHQSVDKLIYAMEHPVKIKVTKPDFEKDKQETQEALCAIKKFLASVK